MASTSTSSIQKSFKYDVFLSFRGEDTRKNFVDNLYYALKHNGIYTYKDDEEINKGKAISDELIRSIEDSRFYVIVFSKNYASSSWCLEELVKIMECQKTNEQTAYPVFYDVEPTEVRNQSGAVGEAFAKHVNKEAAGRWRDALKEAAGLAGWELKNTFDGHEAKLIRKLVDEISLELRNINSNVDGRLIGMETRVKDVVASLETDIYDVRMIGINGMGGAGKTTLARAVFDQICIQFEGSSFVENVRESSKNLLCGLKSLQKQVLSDVLKKQDIIVNGVNDGKNMMKQRMRGTKVLIVLDDVDHIDQLEALAEPSWFKPGSRVIITTRDEQVLVAHGVPMSMILKVSLLSHMEAHCLFYKYAFGGEIPNRHHKELSDQVVRYAAGLPLSIRVLGSFLRGKDEFEWMDALERLKTIPLKETLEILELSYYSLEEDYKEIFLDVACILKGWEKERAIRVLESCDLYAQIGLKVIEQKSLITLSGSGCLDMHDRIVEMGKNIVRRMHPNMPHRHSRLWIKEEIEDILVKRKGTSETRCIKVELLDPVLVMKGLREMKQLRILEVKCGTLEFGARSRILDYDNIDRDIPFHCLHFKYWDRHPFITNRSFDCDNIDEDSLHLPDSLQYLRWDGYPFTCFPKNFLADNLVGLEMQFSNIDQLWKHGEKQVPKKLRFIDLRFCKLRTLDVGMTMNLERLHLESCWKLEELHMPFGSCKLNYLCINDCKSIRTVDLVRAQNLSTLKVTNCGNLLELNISVESTLKLKYLSLRCKLETLNLTLTQNLEMLDLVCANLVELRMPEENSYLKHLRLQCPKLKTLNLTITQKLELLDLLCKDLVELHMLEENPKLKHLSLRCPKLKTLNLTQARNLKELRLLQCEDLLELHMPIESHELKTIGISCSNLKTLNLGLSPYLERLELHDCCNLIEIHVRVGSLTGSVRIKPGMVNQGFPKDDSLAELHIIARSLGICPLHPDNNFPKFHFECIYEELLLSSIPNLAKLISCGLCACENLWSLSGIICRLELRKLTLEGSIPDVPKDLGRLQCLEELSLLSTKIQHFPESIFMLRHLKYLQFKSCWFLKQLPEDIGRLDCLEELHLTDCKSLRDIPDSICEMKRLRCFHLTNCILIERLPKEIGRLKCLKELNIKGTGISDFPPSIFQLEDLLFLL